VNAIPTARQQAANFAVVERLHALALDVGRLRRRLAVTEGWTGGYLIDAVAGHVESLDVMLQPSAAELAWMGIDEALAVVDARADALQDLLLGYRRHGR
jgi:hypothetical protein